jgi:hypothetical protein
MSALRTAANIFFPDPFHQIRHPETGIPLLKLQIFGFHAVVQKAVIADFLETGWKHMHKEAPDKHLITECNRNDGDHREFCHVR